jgi:hypothetical protein
MTVFLVLHLVSSSTLTADSMHPLIWAFRVVAEAEVPIMAYRARLLNDRRRRRGQVLPETL